MEIKIVGPGCKNCQKLKENVETAANDLGITPSITKVEDMAEIGLIIDDKLVVSGRVAKPKEIKQLLQEK